MVIDGKMRKKESWNDNVISPVSPDFSRTYSFTMLKALDIVVQKVLSNSFPNPREEKFREAIRSR